MKASLILACLFVTGLAYGQLDTSFWKLTSSFPAPKDNGYNLSIAVNPDNDAIYVGTSDGLYISTSRGEAWNSIFDSGPVFHVGIWETYIYAVGTEGTVHVSPDEGKTWQSHQLTGVTRINDILILKNGYIYLATGDNVLINDVPSFRGKGIFRSIDKGQSWQMVNAGIGENRYAGHLAADASQRILATVNEFGYHDGKIVYSEDYGSSWKSLPDVSFDWGDGSIDKSDVVNYSTLEIFEDQIYVSFSGANGRVGTQVFVHNSFSNALKDVPWEHISILPVGYPWFYNEPDQVHFARNGDVYVNRVEASFIRGSVFYSSDIDAGFERKPLEYLPLGDIIFSQCHFAETSSGRIYAVQELDFRVYYTDESKAVPAGTPEVSFTEEKVAIYPVPARDFMNIQFSYMVPEEIRIMNSFGAIVYNNTLKEVKGNTIKIRLPELSTGVYFVFLYANDQVNCKKVVVE